MPDDYQLEDNTPSPLAQKTIAVLKDTGRDAGIDSPAQDIIGLVADISGKFERCKTERLMHEQRWLRQWHNFRGMYGSDVVFRDTEQSRAFVKITKTKVLAAQNSIMEILFGNDKFPLVVEPTEKPDGIAEFAHMDMQQAQQGGGQPPEEQDEDEVQDIYGWEGDGKTLPPGATYGSLLGGLEDQYENLPLQSGPAPDLAKMPQINPAEKAALNMQKVILDQITETDGHIHLRKAILEMCMLGQGCIKGPFTIEKTLHDWKKNEDTGKLEYSPKVTMSPGISFVSIWNFFPDPDAKHMGEAEYVIERHKMSASELRSLAKRPHFRKQAIREVLMNTPNYVDQWWEYKLRDTAANIQRNRYEVIEYWGMVDKKLVEEVGVDLGYAMDDLDDVQVNVWLCAGQVLRCVLNPFTPARIPYHSCPYEEHEYQMWGVGVAENMEDCQEIMNAFARLAIDNAAIASNLVFDIDETSLVPGQDMKVHPGKIFRRQAGQPGQAVFGLKFPNTFTDAMGVFDRFRQLADEATGMPSYSHGQTGVNSTTRTSSGLSMLMGAADKNIKGVIKNIDDFFLQPLGEGMFHWNMQFNEEEDIRGDLCIKARGASGLMAKEIKSQRLMQFLQIVANPMLAPFVKFEHICKDIALSLEVDPDRYVNDPTEAALYAQIIGMAGGLGGQGSGSPPQMDASGVGGANIGQGNVPQPGNQGFTGNQQGGQSANAETA